MFSSVVFPAPFGPTMPSACPGNVEREVLDDADASEALGDADDFEQGRHRKVRLRPAGAVRP